MRSSREFVLAVLAAGLLPAAETTILDGSGRIVAMIYSGEELAVRTNLVVASPGWLRQFTLPPGDRVTITRSDSLSVWQGAIEISASQRLNFTETIRERDGKTILGLDYTATADFPAEGIYFRIDLPRDDFAGGTAEFGGAAPSVLFPEIKPAKPDIFGATVPQLAARNASSSLRWSAALDSPRFVNIQDKTENSPQVYTAWVYLHRGNVAAGTRGRLEVELSVAGQPDSMPAHLSLDTTARRYRLDGFGGNYCFNIESPVTQYTLENLRVAWARTEMTLTEWEPENDNASPYDMDWEVFSRRDPPGSNLRREFELARQIQGRGIPYVISIWRLPEWLYTDPGQKGPSDTRRVDPAKWDELLESIGSYLLYARDKYGVEPDLFSFNEANIGVYVLFTAEEHRDAIKSIGAYLESLGLKTKMLLADATGARGTHVYALPAAADPEAMRYVGAVGFHSWGGATPAQYGAWADLAERLGLPLLVTELGLDAAAWRGRSYDSFWYGVKEVQTYQEILLHARPQGTMYWEFTSDYSLIRTTRNTSGREELQPTARFWFTKQFTDLTPPRADALGAESDHRKVLSPPSPATWTANESTRCTSPISPPRAM